MQFCGYSKLEVSLNVLWWYPASTVTDLYTCSSCREPSQVTPLVVVPSQVTPLVVVPSTCSSHSGILCYIRPAFSSPITPCEHLILSVFLPHFPFLFSLHCLSWLWGVRECLTFLFLYFGVINKVDVIRHQCNKFLEEVQPIYYSH